MRVERREKPLRREVNPVLGRVERNQGRRESLRNEDRRTDEK